MFLLYSWTMFLTLFILDANDGGYRLPKQHKVITLVSETNAGQPRTQALCKKYSIIILQYHIECS